MSGRGTGQTTRQIMEAPEDAVFIFAGPREYTRRLRHICGRGDLTLLPLDFAAVLQATAGTYRQIVVDRAFPLTSNSVEHRELGMILELREIQATKLRVMSEARPMTDLAAMTKLAEFIADTDFHISVDDRRAASDAILSLIKRVEEAEATVVKQSLTTAEAHARGVEEGLERAAKVAEGIDPVSGERGQAWVAHSLYDNMRKHVAAAIRGE